MLRLSLALGLSVLGCAQGVEDDGRPRVGGTGGSGAGGSAASSGGGGETPSVVRGSLGAWSGQYASGEQSSVFVGFSETGFACEEERIGPCTLDRCPIAKDAVASSSAGTIRLSGGVQSPITLAFLAGAYTGDHDPNAVIFDGGETITFTAEGDEVPEFSTTLTAPATAVLTSPAGESVTIDTRIDLPIVWSGGSHTLVVALWGKEGTSLARSVSCLFDAAAHEIAVPAEVLAPLAGTTQGSINVLTMSYEYLELGGGWRTGVHLSSIAKQPNGEPGWLPVDFQ